MKHMYIFSMNHGMSKSAVSDSLACEKSSLPQPNNLPGSFQEAKHLISPLLMPLQKYDACINDCVLYRDTKEKQFVTLQSCPVCNEPRTKNGITQKRFTYMPVGPRLSRWFGTTNLCKLLYANRLSVNGTVKDFTDGKLYSSWFQPGGVFEGVPESLAIPLSLFTDGVNPNKHMTSSKSMWPIILTWINLPIDIRQLLGPMLLVGVIPSGIKGSEPKSLEPYLELLIDELLSLTEFTVYNQYEAAPVTVKVALLQFLCDIPAFSKLFHLSGHGALRSCPYCTEAGQHCKHLHKTIHNSNRRFLPADDPLRTADDFGSVEQREKPAPYSPENEIQLREKYDRKPNNNQKSKLQKETGLKGKYSLLRLPYHNRMQQMQPDAMHTLADFIGHLLDALTGKHSTTKVQKCEQSFGRFNDVWNSFPDSAVIQDPRPTKKRKTTKDTSTEIPHSVPWSLSKEQIKEADRRASEICYTDVQDITPGPHFSKPWTLRTMNSKLQFVTSGGLEWCVKGFLPPTQEETLFFLLNVLKRMITPVLKECDVQQLQDDVHTALCLLEKDFPLSLQNLTTHLIHHMVDGLLDFGPVYGRWLFPYERANGWISRQCLRKGVEESTVMETYVIYDWCVHMVLSQQFKPSEVFSGESRLVDLAEKLSSEQTETCIQMIPDQHDQATSRKEKSTLKKSKLTPQMMDAMFRFYVNVMAVNVMSFQDSVMEDHRSCSVVDNCGRTVQYHGKGFKRKTASVVKIPSVSGVQFAEILYFLSHQMNNCFQDWVVLNEFPLATKENGFYCFEPTSVRQRLMHVSLLSQPLVHVRKEGLLWVLNHC
ncbi:uncharacterized protein LOC134273911 [Saccostrea cucullata]|uniref:uncharacterized protein LOC134273911 n=1 Tax=Saccostrea cuccullata TaxID=36930 RepID=UPI002ED62520